MSRIVHYWTNEINLEKYRVEHIAACRVITGFVSPRVGYRSISKCTQDKSEVTCKNCKRTKTFKDDEQSKK